MTTLAYPSDQDLIEFLEKAHKGGYASGLDPVRDWPFHGAKTIKSNFKDGRFQFFDMWFGSETSLGMSVVRDDLIVGTGRNVLGIKYSGGTRSDKSAEQAKLHNGLLEKVLANLTLARLPGGSFLEVLPILDTKYAYLSMGNGPSIYNFTYTEVILEMDTDINPEWLKLFGFHSFHTDADLVECLVEMGNREKWDPVFYHVHQHVRL